MLDKDHKDALELRNSCDELGVLLVDLRSALITVCKRHLLVAAEHEATEALLACAKGALLALRKHLNSVHFARVAASDWVLAITTAAATPSSAGHRSDALAVARRLRAAAKGTIWDDVENVSALQGHVEILTETLDLWNADAEVLDVWIEKWEGARGTYMHGVTLAAFLGRVDVAMLATLLMSRKRKQEVKCTSTACDEMCDNVMVSSGGLCSTCWQKDPLGRPGARPSKKAVADAGLSQFAEAVVALKVPLSAGIVTQTALELLTAFHLV
jgi:hypothetical protein